MSRICMQNIVFDNFSHLKQGNSSGNCNIIYFRVSQFVLLQNHLLQCGSLQIIVRVLHIKIQPSRVNLIKPNILFARNSPLTLFFFICHYYEMKLDGHQRETVHSVGYTGEHPPHVECF